MRFNTIRTLLACTLLFLSAPAAAHAQLLRGDRVRVKLGARRIAEGIYLGNDSLGYALIRNEADTSRIPLDGGYLAERAVAIKSHGLETIGVGAGVGAGVGVALLALQAMTANGHEDGVGYALALGAGILTTMTGFIVGTVLAVVGHDEWQAVSLLRSPDSSAPADFVERTTPDSTMRP